MDIRSIIQFCKVFTDNRSIDVIIGKLRRKLKDNSQNPAFLKTVRQQGYMFIADTQRQKRRG